MPAYAPAYEHDHENEVVLFGQTNFRNQARKFGIKTDDRRRHVYVIGKTGMGKTTLLENMVLADVYAGHGLCYIDPHGDTAEKFLDFIPPHRTNDVVYFNPADMEFPIGFNILETVDESQKHLVASGLMGVFKKIWPDVWSSRMEYILLNTIMALLDFPGSTLLGINRLLSDEEFRKRVVSLIQDPVVKTFWVKEFASFSEKYRTEAVAPLQNKVGQFLSATVIRNIVAQVKSTIDMRDIMDTRKIFIVNLSKGRIGEENSRLLGAMIITRLQLAAMERVDMPEKSRQDFYLYVDEFQNFATESFANILSEARKYRLALIVAHQYIEQLDEMVRAAIFGNVGTIIAFRVGAADATFMEAEFMPRFTPEDLVNLKKYEVYLKLMIDGASSEPFSANTLAPIAENTGSMEKVIKVSRERYSMPRKTIEEKVIKWSGFGTVDTGQTLLTEDEEEAAIAAKIEELEASSPNVGEMAQPADGGGFGKKKAPKKPQFEVPCSVCGKISELTFEPDWSKPWLCKEHLEMKQKGLLPKSAIKLPPASANAKAVGAAPLPPAAVPVAAPVVVPPAAPVQAAPTAPKPVPPAPKPAVAAATAVAPAAPVAAKPAPAAPAVAPVKPAPSSVKAPPPKLASSRPAPATPALQKVTDVKPVSLGSLPPRPLAPEARAERSVPAKDAVPVVPTAASKPAAAAAPAKPAPAAPKPAEVPVDEIGIPSKSHKPRIVMGGTDDAVDELLAAVGKKSEPAAPDQQKKPVHPVEPFGEPKPPAPEPFGQPKPEAPTPPAPKSDDAAGGAWKPGQVIKF